MKTLKYVCILALLLALTASLSLAQSPVKPCTSSTTPSWCSAVRGDRPGNWLGQGRSETMSQHGMVATSQSLAAEAGLRVLMAGGNAIDAAVATAATLNLMEPMNVGLGGDLYAIIYIAKEKKLYQLNAGDMMPEYATVDYYKSHHFKTSHCITNGRSTSPTKQIKQSWFFHFAFSPLWPFSCQKD